MSTLRELKRIFSLQLNIREKLIAVCLLLFVPIGYLVFVLTAHQERDLSLARKEATAMRYLRGCRGLLEQLIHHRQQVHRQLVGERLPLAESSRLTRSVEEGLKGLEQPDPAGTLERPSKERLAALRRSWDRIVNRSAVATPGAMDDLHQEMIKDVRGLMTQAGHSAGLVMDPELDAISLADILLFKLPDQQDLLSRLLDHGEELVGHKDLKPEERTQLAVDSAQIRTVLDELNSPGKGLPAAFRHDVSPGHGLKAALEPHWQLLQAATASYLGRVKEKMLEASAPSLTAAEYTQEANQALEASFKLWDETARALDGLLEARVARLSQQRWWTLAGVALSLVPTLLVVLLIIQRITQQIHSVTGTFDAIATGDYQARARVLSPYDELGHLAGSLNSMLDRTVGLLQSREERDQIQASITKLLEEISGVAEGDLTKEAEVTADITGAIADSFNFMIEQLRRVISNVQDATMQVSTAATAINNGAELLVQGSEGQAVQIVQTTGSVNGLSESIQQVAFNADRSAEVATQALVSARQGGEAVSNTIEGMNRIRDQVQETAKRIKRLGESTQQIGEIVQLIDDIADRTSILALNASIQAAMAGEAGRGFAVVAEEVERLAERSASATKKIASLVKTIQSETNEAVTAMEDNTREVVEGSRLAYQAGQALGEIETVSTTLADLIQSISESARQQAEVSTQIADAMEGISEVTQQTAAGTKQTSASVYQLASLADDLRSSVSTFRLPGRLSRGDIIIPSKPGRNGSRSNPELAGV
jgi:twitching motility protein PilJ